VSCERTITSIVARERSMGGARRRVGVCVAAAVVAAIVLSSFLVSAAGAGAVIWSIQRMPVPAGATSTVLHGVSCTSPDACTAVGGPDGRPGIMLAERWNGSRWTIQRTPRPAESILSFLDGVSCVSAWSCVAVGFVVDRAGADAVLTMRWDGSSWSMVRIAKPAGSIESVLESVSCTSQTACTAVGSSADRSGVWFTLVERWNGSRWSVQPTPRSPYSELLGVSCGSAHACTAVGGSADGSELMEHWSAGRWLTGHSLDLTMPESGLNAVSCMSATACTAVGEEVVPSTAVWPLLASWNDYRWSVQPLRGQPLGVVYGVSCTSRTTCTAVGADSLVEAMNGTRWTLERAPDPEQSNLFGVSCAGRICVAVGSWIDVSGWEAPLVESTIARG